MGQHPMSQNISVLFSIVPYFKDSVLYSVIQILFEPFHQQRGQNQIDDERDINNVKQFFSTFRVVWGLFFWFWFGSVGFSHIVKIVKRLDI
jgi:p-aminobenzoyl-glutamate transporter AbgT